MNEMCTLFNCQVTSCCTNSRTFPLMDGQLNAESMQRLELISCMFCWLEAGFQLSPPYSTQQLCSDDCLENERKYYQNCSVLYCVLHLYPVISTSSSYTWTGYCWRTFGLRFACACVCLSCGFFGFWVISQSLVVWTGAVDCLEQICFRSWVSDVGT